MNEDFFEKNEKAVSHLMCKVLLEHVRDTTSGISDMERLMNEVLSQTDSMAQIADESYKKSSGYIDTMERAAGAVEQIGESGKAA